MIKFRTEIEIPHFQHKIEYHQKLFFIGSCFAANIGARCQHRGLKTMINPFGVTYNPLSVIEVLRHIIECKCVDEDMFRKVDGNWCSLLHHSSFDAPTLEEVKESTERVTSEANEFLKESSYLFITFGTAWVYMDKKSGKIVNNCHKIADKEFVRRKLSIAEIVETFSNFIDDYPWKIIFTVSPIRHLKDSLVGNSLSKATLLTAVGELCEKYPDHVSYFPSYEIMLDDLRDYRFYEADMLHPNGVAIDYIDSIFEKALLSESCVDYCRKMVKIVGGMEHRVIAPESEAHKKFKDSMLVALRRIEKEYPLGDYETKFNFFK